MNTGFFSLEETGKGNQLNKYIGCGGCGLYKNSKYPKQKLTGSGNKKILIIGTYSFSPNQFDFVYLLKKYKIDVEKDCWWINSVNCSLYENKKPSPNEINMCRPKIWEAINKLKPKLIFLLGESALISFLGNRWIKGLGGINKWLSYTIPDRKAQAWVCPILSPEFIENKKEKQPVIKRIWEKDIKNALSYLNTPFPDFSINQSYVSIIRDKEQLRNIFKKILQRKPNIGIDFETSGKKPQAPNHFIKCCSISVGEKCAYVFLIPEKKTENYNLFCEILENPEIHKFIQNMKFELNWAYSMLNIIIKGIIWDSQLASHIIDNRPGTTSLKFQVYINFGIMDYSSHLDPYIKGPDKKGGNVFNNINQAPLNELLIYCGQDSLFLYRLTKKQMGILRHVV